MPVYTNALAPQPANSLAYPGGIGKRGGSLDSFVPLDYSRLAAGQFRQDTPQMREYAANVPLDVLRGRFAGMLGFPSDVLNMVRTPSPMEMFGQTDYEQPTQVPYGTEQLLKTLPLAPAADNPLGQVANRVGSFVPITPMEALQAARVARQAAMATGRFVAPKAGQLAEQYMVNMGGMIPLDVYHGTPHTLPPTPRNPLGEFDASKIGTGEGAQAYGHGLYLAGEKSTAEYYKQLALGALDANPYDASVINRFMGKSKTPSNDYEGLAAYALADSMVSPFKYSPVEAMKRLRDKARESRLPQDTSNQLFGLDTSIQKDQLKNAAKYIREFSDKTDGTGAISHLYKVDLPDEHIAKMLDWDKPLSQQHPDVQAALKRRITSVEPTDKFDMGGNARLRDNSQGQFDK